LEIIYQTFYQDLKPTYALSNLPFLLPLNREVSTIPEAFLLFKAVSAFSFLQEQLIFPVQLTLEVSISLHFFVP